MTIATTIQMLAAILGILGFFKVSGLEIKLNKTGYKPGNVEVY